MIRDRQARPERAPLAIALACAALGGCLIDGRRNGSGYYAPAPNMSIPVCPSGSGAAPSVAIDTGAALTTPAGEGAGIFVEYQTGGHWHIWTSCDTAITGQGCAYDVTAQFPGSTVSNVRGEGLESGDFVGSQCADTAFLSVNTGTTSDGMLFDAPAGSPARVTGALGAALYPDILYWVGDNVARNDANANPVDFSPTSP